MRPPKEQSVAGAVAVFALTGFVVVALLGLAAVEVIRTTATDEALRNATELTALAGRAVVAPAIDDGLAEGRRASQRRLASAVDKYVLSDSVVRVKLWTADGMIVWSDEPRLIGARYDLREDELEALHQEHVTAGVSDLDEPENRFERHYGRLIEVSRGVRTPDGQQLLFETYVRSSVIQASGERIWRRFIPVLIGALLALELIQIPLAYLLASRLRDRQRERSALLERAIDASEDERRKIAGSLHDGPVQQLAGVAFSLAAAARDQDAGGQARSAVVGDAASQVRSTIRDLRATLVDLYPASLHRSGLDAAVADLLAPLDEAGVTTELDVEGTDFSDAQERLLFRGAREGLQNVRVHSRASNVSVRVQRDGPLAVLEIRDDGIGFDVDHDAEGHFGLKLLSDLAAAEGGRLDITSVPGDHTLLRLEVPA